MNALKKALGAKDGDLDLAQLVAGITPEEGGEKNDELEDALQKAYGVTKADLAGMVGAAVKTAVGHGQTQLNGRLPD